MFARTTFALSLLILSLPLSASERRSALSIFVDANTTFGMKLLQQAHARTPNTNTVISPLPVSLTFAALRGGFEDYQATREIDKAFGWYRLPPVSGAAHVLSGAFEKPPVVPKIDPGQKSRLRNSPEEAWVSSTLAYVQNRRIDPITRNFAETAKFHRLELRAVHRELPSGKAFLKSLAAIDRSVPQEGAWIISSAHLQTAWQHNTFSMSEIVDGQFTLASGEKKYTRVMSSATEMYLHAQTATYEAVALPCISGYMEVVVPARGRTVEEVENELASDMDRFEASMKPELGLAVLPLFSFKSELDFRPILENMGVKMPFKDLTGIVSIPNSRIRTVRQVVDIAVDKDGIRANAETVTGIVVGGIATGKPFVMNVDRPFIFLIRDSITHSLLFAGVVMDPSIN